MPNRILIFAAAIALGLLGACQNSPPVNEPTPTPTTVDIGEAGDEGEGVDPDDVVSGTGTIRYIDLEGGFYGIVTRGNQRYLPQNLPDSLKQAGQPVRFRGTVRRDVMTYQQWGTPLELIDITRVTVLDDE